MTYKRKLYCSTGCMVGRVNGFNYKQAIDNLVKLQDDNLIDGIELMMLNFYYDKLEEVANYIIRSKVNVAIIHCEKDIGTILSDIAIGLDSSKEKYDELLDKFKMNLHMAKTLNVNRMVLHLWGGVSSDSAVGFNSNYLINLINISKEYNVKLLIENVPCALNDPLDNWGLIKEYVPDIGYIFDTRFGKFHNDMENIWNSQLSKYIEHVHISDFVGFEDKDRDFSKLRPILHPGEGKVDFDRFFEIIKNKQYCGSFTIESPVMTNDGGVDIEKMKKTLNYVSKSIGRI